MAENTERRANWDRDHAITDPALKAIAAAKTQAAINRAEEVAKIAGVVTIRTRPSISRNQ